MEYKIVELRRAKKALKDHKYQFIYYLLWNYSWLGYILSKCKRGYKQGSYSDVYIMFDTETSKDHEPQYDRKGQMILQENHICAWSLSIRAFHTNIVTLRGSKPSELIHCMELIRSNLKADHVYFFAHNLAYDWQFCRRFMLEAWNDPIDQLNTKPHYPLYIEFENGIILRDSLILAGVSLEKWAKNLGVKEKAIGKWDYDKIRHQNCILSADELTYIECDVVAGVECLNKLADMLHDSVVSLPLTNTGIIRRRIQKVGKEFHAKSYFNKMSVSYEDYEVLERLFFGGYTHANRYMVEWIWKNVICYDFTSSYPYCMLAEKYPCERFTHLDRQYAPEEILEDSERYSYVFKFIAVNIRMKDLKYPMPCLQYFKCESSINAVNDNGRILNASYIEIYANEQSLKLIQSIYQWDEAYCVDVMAAKKDYLPKWYRDEIFSIFEDKCKISYKLKECGVGDQSEYNLIKGQLNSLYGMCCQKKIRDEIREVYHSTDPEMPSGEYYFEPVNREEAYYDNDKKLNNILPYVWGIYTTSYAMIHLYELAECINDIHNWIYSDTDSIYSNDWNQEKLQSYNQHIKDKLIEAGYGAVIIKDKEYWLGIAEFDKSCDEFITTGSKRYAYSIDGKITITCAGVPKKAGSAALENLNDFQAGYIFEGKKTGKKYLAYDYSDIHTDKNGNEVGDWIDMLPADYTLSSINFHKIDDLFLEDILIQVYD